MKADTFGCTGTNVSEDNRADQCWLSRENISVWDCLSVLKYLMNQWANLVIFRCIHLQLINFQSQSLRWQLQLQEVMLANTEMTLTLPIMVPILKIITKTQTYKLKGPYIFKITQQPLRLTQPLQGFTR